jgi:ribosomal protein S13
VILFTAVGNRFSKVVISPKEISIEQMVENLESDIQKIEKFIDEENPTNKIADIVEDTLEHPRDIWSKLLLIRTTLRRLLRNIADRHGMFYSPTASISRMIADFRQQEIIDDLLNEQIERIRNATFTVEWGAGQPPEPEEVKFVLENYNRVFNTLKDIARQIAQA